MSRRKPTEHLPQPLSKYTRPHCSKNISMLFGSVFDMVMSPYCSRRDLASLSSCASQFTRPCLKALLRERVVNVDTLILWEGVERSFVRKIRVSPADFSTMATLAPNATHVMLDYEAENVNTLFPELLPKNVTVLSMTNLHPEILLVGTLSKNIKNLDIEWPDGKALLPCMLPESLEILRFRGNFNQSLFPGMFPRLLMNLNLGQSFNKVIPIGIFPDSLEILQLGRDFSHLQPHALPGSLRQLILNQCNLMTPIAIGVLPEGLEMLNLVSIKTTLLPGSLPTSLTDLQWISGTNLKLVASLFPPHLKNLEVSRVSEVALGALPASLEHLWMFCCFTGFTLLPHVLPPNIKSLMLVGYFNQKDLRPSCFPQSLERLTLGDHFDEPILPGTLPKSIKYLKFGSQFNQDLGLALPAELDELVLGSGFSMFDQPIRKRMIPKSVSVLNLGRSFAHPLTRGVLPTGLRRLYISQLHPDSKKMNSRVLGCRKVEVLFHEL